MLAAMRVQATRCVERGVRPRVTRRRPETATRASNNDFVGCSIMIRCRLEKDAIAGSSWVVGRGSGKSQRAEDGASELNPISNSACGVSPPNANAPFVLPPETRADPSFSPLSHPLPVSCPSNFPQAQCVLSLLPRH